MSEMTPRELIGKANWHNSRADAAHHAMVKIRLLQKPVQRDGLLRFLRKAGDVGEDLVFDEVETLAIYEALSIVKRNHEDRASSYESRVVAASSVPGRDERETEG